jgi:hypothetical protein
MLEHLSSLRRKNSDSAQTTTNEKQPDTDHKEVSDINTVHSKSKNNIFKNLISDNSATNIFQNLMKCPENISSHLGTAMSSSSNGSCKPKASTNEDDNNNQQMLVNTTVTTIVQPANLPANVQHKKRNSVVKLVQNSNGDLNISQRELSPSPRAHRKSSHDIRLLRNQTLLGESSEVGKVTAVKPLKTKNIITKNETFDTLHCRAIDVSTVNELHFYSFNSINYASKLFFHPMSMNFERSEKDGSFFNTN